MAKGTWILERTQNDRFPYRLQIIRGDRPWLVLRTQDHWPAAGSHIFCLTEEEPPTPDEVLEELERVNIVAFNERGAIPFGDYALMDGDKMLAVVERKTLDNLLADFGTMPVLHQKLSELAAHDNHALVIEAPYADFLNHKKVHHHTPSFCAKAIAELYALHPGLRTFCANRKNSQRVDAHFFCGDVGPEAEV